MKNNKEKEIPIEEDRFRMNARNAVLIVAENYSKGKKKVLIIDYSITPITSLLVLLFGYESNLDMVEEGKIYHTKWSYDIVWRPRPKLLLKIIPKYDIIIKVKPQINFEENKNELD